MYKKYKLFSLGFLWMTTPFWLKYHIVLCQTPADSGSQATPKDG